MNQASSSPRRRTHPPSAAPLPFFVFIAYGDVASARDALERTKELLRASRCARAVHPMFWRFDQLGHPRWREMALHDAMRAHTVVLAMGDASSLDGTTDSWLTALANRNDGAPITCLTFMRDDEAWTISLQRCEASERFAAAQRDVAPRSPIRRAPAARAA